MNEHLNYYLKRMKAVLDLHMSCNNLYRLRYIFFFFINKHFITRIRCDIIVVVLLHPSIHVMHFLVFPPVRLLARNMKVEMEDSFIQFSFV